MNSFILWIKEFFVWHSSQFDNIHKLFDKNYFFLTKIVVKKKKKCYNDIEMKIEKVHLIR